MGQNEGGGSPRQPPREQAGLWCRREELATTPPSLWLSIIVPIMGASGGPSRVAHSPAVSVFQRSG